AGLQQILVAVQGVIAGTATLGTTLTVATGGLALLGVAAGVAYYAFTKYSEQQKEILEGSSNFFKNIEVEVASLNKQ
ncbi:hypothetical protein OFB80_35150, partial [Escherichia coli]|nr:hypothetical protein [Escherichia coli]